jgi:ATPase subunit of ABC transporter with duplicated ATPase domains
MSSNTMILRFKNVSFKHTTGVVTLDDTSFSLREGAKVALMGQNGAGKSTLFGLIMGTLTPSSGGVFVENGTRIALARQVMPRECFSLTVEDFLAQHFPGKDYDLKRKIAEVFEIVHLDIPIEKKIENFSGGQQARILLASALIQDPDILLLDEPTNNLDTEGIGNLMTFLMMYEKTCIVISHDADFLNTFTEGVLYLDIHTHTIEQYQGDYYDVVEEISARIEKEKMKNAQFERKIRENKEKINYFQNKGGKMRLLAKKMRDEVAEMEASKVDVRKDDKVIRSFSIPEQEDLQGDILTISEVSLMQNHQETSFPIHIVLRKNKHLLLKGPNGIGKTTLLERLASGHARGESVLEGVRIGYYRQDFSTLDFESTVYNTLMGVMQIQDEEEMRSVASGFLLTSENIYAKIGSLSEGQKGLVAFAQLVLLKPGLLILDEPTNHINFRHIPRIASALDAYKGAMVLVSHDSEFVRTIRIDEELDLLSIKPSVKK